MTAALWAVLVPALVALAGAAASWLKSQGTQKALRAHLRTPAPLAHPDLPAQP
jgi:hypothetical protein